MKGFDFKAVESKWLGNWEKSKVFSTSSKPHKKFYCLEMFAYPSGDIHMGHFRNYTIGDVVARYRMMKGYDVLHPFGWDAFGMPAEAAAIKNNLHPKDWTLKNVSQGRKTLKKMGISYDWSREVTTCLPDYYKWTQWLFLLLYKKGLAYQAKSQVNWCPQCQTILANEQAQDGICWRCKGAVVIKDLDKCWFFKYTDYAEMLLQDINKLDGWPENVKTMQRNWIGRSEGCEIDFGLEDSPDKFTVFTTRPDTIYGVTFMAIAPEHPYAKSIAKGTAYENEVNTYIQRSLSKKDIERTAVGEKDGVFTGRFAVNPLNGEHVQLWVADYVLAAYGTGVVMGVPAHDQRDFLFAKKYKIPFRPVIKPTASWVMQNSSEIRLTENIENLTNTLRDAIDVGSVAADEIRQITREGYWNSEQAATCLQGIYMNSPRSFDSAYTGEGEMFNSGPFDGVISSKGIQEVIEYVEQKGYGRKKINYKLKDWLISRQRYWGCPIPIVHCPKCGIVPVPEKNLPVLLPNVRGKNLLPKGRSPLDDVSKYINTKCPKCKKPAKRDTDTMDTFMDSSFYLFRYTDAHNKKKPWSLAEAKKWLPVDIYIGGIEHACMHLLYFRFITKVLYDAGWLSVDEPVTRLYNHGMVLDEQGRIMSKSLGNVVSPAEVFNEWGVDVARIAMLFFAPSDWEIRWSKQGLIGAQRFINRLWQNVADIKSALSNENVWHWEIANWTNVIKKNSKDDGAYFQRGNAKAELGDWVGARRDFDKAIKLNPKSADFHYNRAVVHSKLGDSEREAADLEKAITMNPKFTDAYYHRGTAKPDVADKFISLRRKLHQVIKKATDELEGKMHFNTVIAQVMELLNLIDESKPLKPTNAEERRILKELNEGLVSVMAPMSPFIAEEFWEMLGNRASVFKAHWPEFDPDAAKEDEVEIAVQVNGKVRHRLKVSTTIPKEELEKLVLATEEIKKFIGDKPPRKIIVVPNKLVNLVV